MEKKICFRRSALAEQAEALCQCPARTARQEGCGEECRAVLASLSTSVASGVENMLSCGYMPNSKKAELQKELKEIELQLKNLQQQFLDIKNRSKNSVSSARKRADERKLSELRKQLGIEK